MILYRKKWRVRTFSLGSVFHVLLAHVGVYEDAELAEDSFTNRTNKFRCSTPFNKQPPNITDLSLIADFHNAQYICFSLKV